MLLDDITELNQEGQHVNEGYQDIPSAIYSLFEASTTANFPAQMLPCFIQWRSSFLFFGFFMVLTVMIFLNLLLAVVFNGYSEAQGDQVKTRFTNRAKGLAAAFRILSGPNMAVTPHITLYDFKALVSCLNKAPVARTFNMDDAELYFETLDDDSSESLEQSEFYDLCATETNAIGVIRQHDNQFIH